jgi:23S rRNA pseudouridine2605 synthase
MSLPLNLEHGAAGQWPIRLNAYLARAGIASRRGADKLIKAGRVTINGSAGQCTPSRSEPGDRVETWPDVRHPAMAVAAVGAVTTAAKCGIVRRHAAADMSLPLNRGQDRTEQ